VPTVHVEHRSTAPVVISAALANAASASTTPAAPAPSGTRSTAPTKAPSASTSTAPAPTSTTVPPPRVVALFGDSIADWLLHDAAPTFTRTDVTLVDVAVEGCDAAVDIPKARGRAGQILAPPADCTDWKHQYPVAVENPKLPIDVAVLVLGQAPILDRLVDGRWVGPCETTAWYERDLANRIAYLRPRVGEVVLALPSWGGKKASFLSTEDHLVRMGCIRAGLTALATRLHVPTVDLAEELCPAGPSGQCTALRDRDGTHVDPEDAPVVLDWLLDKALAAR
jgi:hypothetical protein